MDFHWERNTWLEIEELRKEYPVVVVTVGSVEQHGIHCSLDTDSTSVYSIAEEAARRLWERGSQVLLCPHLWYGYSEHHMDFPGSITLSSRTLQNMVVEICKAIVHHGFSSIFVLNGHGGNLSTLRVSARRVAEEVKAEPKPMIAVASYWTLAADRINEIRESLPGGIRHAGELETSLQLFLRDEFVKKDLVKDNTQVWKTGYILKDLAADKSRVSFWPSIKDISETGAVGASHLGTIEKGEKFFDAIVKDIMAFLEEFKTWKIGEI